MEIKCGFWIAAVAAAVTLAGTMSVAAPVAPNEISAHPGLLARLPDGRRLNFRCSGQGAPTVVLEGGYAATSLAWGRVRALVSKTNRVCTYDRAGYGFSDPGPLPRDGAAIARDLDRGLRAAKISGPFIVVGHSAGALYVRLFSNRRPREVVGMVLVDPSVEYQEQRFAAEFGPGAGSVAPIRAVATRCLAAAEQDLLPSTDPGLVRCSDRGSQNQPASVVAARLAESIRASTWRTKLSELDNLWTSTSAQLSDGRQSYGELPLIVLTAGGTYSNAPEPARSAVQGLWERLHQELAARSTRGVNRQVADSSHMMMNDRPEVVAAAISEVAEAASPQVRR